MLCVGGSELARVSSRLQAGRQPCVRPVSAVHDAAGNKSIRSRLSGAFDDALALVGCPGRRIDRLCTHAGWPTRPRFRMMEQSAILLTGAAPGGGTMRPFRLYRTCAGWVLGWLPRLPRHGSEASRWRGLKLRTATFLHGFQE